PVAVVPLPKSHDHSTTWPELASVKVTASGAPPRTGSAMNCACSVSPPGACVTVTFPFASSVRSGPVQVSVMSNDPVLSYAVVGVCSVLALPLPKSQTNGVAFWLVLSKLTTSGTGPLCWLISNEQLICPVCVLSMVTEPLAELVVESSNVAVSVTAYVSSAP